MQIRTTLYCKWIAEVLHDGSFWQEITEESLVLSQIRS